MDVSGSERVGLHSVFSIVGLLDSTAQNVCGLPCSATLSRRDCSLNTLFRRCVASRVMPHCSGNIGLRASWLHSLVHAYHRGCIPWQGSISPCTCSVSSLITLFRRRTTWLCLACSNGGGGLDVPTDIWGMGGGCLLFRHTVQELSVLVYTAQKAHSLPLHHTAQDMCGAHSCLWARSD